MSAHNANNSQCDLNMYGPDPGDGSVKCTCDEDLPIEPAVGPARPKPQLIPGHPLTEAVERWKTEAGGPEHPHFGTGPHVVTLQGRAATTHAELRDALREFRTAREIYGKAEQRWKAALDAHMQEIA